MTGLEMRGAVSQAMHENDMVKLRELIPELLTAFCQLGFERKHRAKCTAEDCWCRKDHG